MNTDNSTTVSGGELAQEKIIFTEEIERALEMMRRSRRVNAANVADAGEEAEGNRYTLPEPLVLHAGVS